MTAGSSGARARAGLALALLGLGAMPPASPAPSLPSGAQGLQPIPKLTARVTDLTGTLSAEQQSALEQKLAAFESARGSQLALLLVATTEPEQIEQYSIRVVDEWKLGRHKVDDGALLIIARNDHRVRIEVGYGLEGVLTDAMCNRIISETLRPAFRQGNYYAGIDAGLEQMMKLIEGEPLQGSVAALEGLRVVGFFDGAHDAGQAFRRTDGGRQVLGVLGPGAVVPDVDLLVRGGRVAVDLHEEGSRAAKAERHFPRERRAFDAGEVAHARQQVAVERAAARSVVAGRQ